jgi:hypothetical protein
MTKLRSFLAGLLLVPVLTLNASPLRTEADRSGLEPTRPVAAWCWIYHYGRWIVVPC